MALIALIGLPLLGGSARCEWIFSADALARFNDNVGNAADARDRLSDESLAGRISLTRFAVLPGNYTVNVGGEVSGEWFDHFTGLRHADAAATVSLRRKWGAGALAPWLRAAFSVGRDSYDASYRSYTRYRGALATGRRLDERISLMAEYAFEQRAARAGDIEEPGISGDAFSGRAHSLALTIECLAKGPLAFNGTLLLRRGDVVSSYYYEPSYYDHSRAIESDGALGDDHYAYRFLGTTYGVRLGASYALGTHQLLSLALQRLDTHVQGSRYLNNMPELRWDYRY
jgi:hypothetical protein